jgi:hypothetical protein
MSAPAAIRLLEAKREQYRCGSSAYGISIARPCRTAVRGAAIAAGSAS